jgi:hypothetical protein
VRCFDTRHRHVLPAASFILLIGGIYLPVLTGTRSLLTNGAIPAGPFFVADPLAGGPITVPLDHLASIAWTHRQLPVFDPFQGYGIPLLPNQGVPAYLPQLAFQILFPHNYSVWNVVNLATLAFGAYLLASSFGQRRLAAMAAGTAAALAGVAPPNLNMAMLNPLAILPFTLLAIRFALDPGSRHRRVAWLGVATSAFLLATSGFQEVLPLFAIVGAVYALALTLHLRTWRRRPGLVVSTVGSGVVGALMGSIGLFPTLAAVRSGAGLNGPGSYALHVPAAWMATLAVPSLARGAMVGQPQDLGQSVWVLGTPILLVVVVLAGVIAVRQQGRHLGWYVWPSIALVAFGILAYANLLGVLRVFDLPLLDSIVMVRLLPFAWWIPWCLLLGVVVSHPRWVRWTDVLAALVASGLVGVVMVARFRDALVAQHLSRYLGATRHASLIAATVVGAFALAIVASRWVGARVSSAALAAIVLASGLHYLPTNFFPAAGGTAVTTVGVAGAEPATAPYLADLTTMQQPTTYFSAQVWGPIVPSAYQQVMTALFSAAETSGYGPIYDAVPTLGFVTIDPRAVSVLRSLGVTTVVTTSALPTGAFGPIPHCRAGSPPAPAAGLCSLGRATAIGGPPAPRGHAYRILGATPLVDAAARPVAVRDDGQGLRALLARLSPTAAALPDDAFVTTGGSSPTPAQGLVGVSRRATTQAVTMTVRASGAGLAILRQTYERGMTATVNGRRTPALAVDGGLWTAVEVGAGRSRVVLDYTTTADLVEVAVAVAGVLLLLAAWVGVAVSAAGTTSRRGGGGARAARRWPTTRWTGRPGG